MTVVLKLGSFVSGSGRARSVKAAKTEAARSRSGASSAAQRIRSIDGSDARSNARSAVVINVVDVVVVFVCCSA